MTKLYLFALVLALTLGFAFKVSAQISPTKTQVRTSTSSATVTTQKPTRDTQSADWVAQMRQLRDQKKTLLMERRKSFQEKLKNIKDERKRVLVDRIDSKIINLNRQRTEEMAQALIKLQTILERLNTKINEAHANGIDTASASAAYDNAKNAVAAAEAAVASQSAKTYTIDISSDEAALKRTVGAVTSSFQSDLQATHKKVVEAKQAVSRAAQQVALLRGVKNSPQPTKTNGQPK